MALFSVSSSSAANAARFGATARWTERDLRLMATNRQRLRRSPSLVCNSGRCLMSMCSGAFRKRKRREAEIVVMAKRRAFAPGTCPGPWRACRRRALACGSGPRP